MKTTTTKAEVAWKNHSNAIFKHHSLNPSQMDSLLYLWLRIVHSMYLSWHDCARNNLALSWNESPSITIVSSVIVYIWRKCLIMIIGIDKSSESSLDYQCWMRRERRTFIQHAERNQRAMSCHDYLWILGCCCWHIIILTSLRSSQSDLKRIAFIFL